MEVGNKVFIRTCTYHHVGQIKAITPESIVLEKASWVADSGRFNHALKTGDLSEVEPFEDDVEVFKGAIVDATIWHHDLPTVPK